MTILLHHDMMLEFRPILSSLEENTEFLGNTDCQASLQMSVTFYSNVGYYPPWIGYYARLDGEFVGAGGFKGRPVDGKVELAYGTFPQYQKMGIGTEICRMLVQLANLTDPSVRVMARTLPEENFSTRILRKNGFELQGNVIDKDDGDVWEWEYAGSTPGIKGTEV